MIDTVASVGLSAATTGAKTAANTGASGAEFESTLRSVVASTVDQLGLAERTSLSALQGQATARQVVDAVMRAEQSLQTMIAVRDKAVGALQEITRMSI